MSKNLMCTYSGLWVDPFNLKLADVSIDDIGHHLSNLCRYTGAVGTFYSVAEHSTILAEEAMRRWGPKEALYLLLHDGEEAYLGDVGRPIKYRPEFLHYCRACDRATKCIMEKYGPVDMATPVSELKLLDDEMVYHEAHALMPEPESWPQHVITIVPSFNPRIEALVPRMAELKFFMAYKLYHDRA